MTETEIQELKAKHGALHELAQSGDTVVVRAPTRADFKRFRAQVADESKRPIALEQLLLGCVVHPDKPTLDAMLERKPGLVESFGKALMEIAGAQETAEKKAL